MAKLQSSQALTDLNADLEAMTGVQLRLVGSSCKAAEVSAPCSSGALCQRVRSSCRGAAHCRRFVEGLIVDSKSEELSSSKCDAGLEGFCVPLRLGGEILGYLLAGGYRTGEIDLTTRNRLRHLLGRLNIPEEEKALEEFENDSLVLSGGQHEAIKRWLQLAASALIRGLEIKEDAAERPLPKFVIKICAIIQRSYKEPPKLNEAAEICNLSEGYFCRAFHEHTGLRYVEYIHAVRIEHVCDLLLDRDVSITEAAFDVGFHSLSQFNRVFRKLKGISPRQWRSAEISKLNAASY